MGSYSNLEKQYTHTLLTLFDVFKLNSGKIQTLETKIRVLEAEIRELETEIQMLEEMK